MSELEDIRARRETQKRQRQEYRELMARGVQNLSRDEQLRARILDDSAHIIWENELDVLLDVIERQQAVIDAAKAYFAQMDQDWSDYGDWEFATWPGPVIEAENELRTALDAQP